MTHLVKSPLNFLIDSLGSLTRGVIDERGVAPPGSVEGGVNVGSVGSLRPPSPSVEGGVGGVPPERVRVDVGSSVGGVVRPSAWEVSVTLGRSSA